MLNLLVAMSGQHALAALMLFAHSPATATSSSPPDDLVAHREIIVSAGQLMEDAITRDRVSGSTTYLGPFYIALSLYSDLGTCGLHEKLCRTTAPLPAAS